MKKENCDLIILVMLCRQDIFRQEFEIISDFWNGIKEDYPSVKLFGYVGGAKKNEIDEEKNLISLKVEDDLNHTFEKTSKAFKLIGKRYEYDYMFRTNTSTAVNIDLLLEFINRIKGFNHEIIYTSEIYRNATEKDLKAMKIKECKSYYTNDIYGRGNGLLLSKELVKILTSSDIKYKDYSVDDFSIGCILNEYHRKTGKLFNGFFIKQMPHAWIKAVSNGHRQYFGNRWCSWGNKNDDFDFLKRFITVQVKKYDDFDRNHEVPILKETLEKFRDNRDTDIKKTADEAFQFTVNAFDIFISINLGYLQLNL